MLQCQLNTGGEAFVVRIHYDEKVAQNAHG